MKISNTKTTNENFIKVSTELRRRTDISSTEKIILAYLLSFQANNQVCYQTEEELSFELGISLSTLKRSIVTLIEMNICYKEKASLHTGKRQYKNRKAIIVSTTQIKEEANTIDLSNDIKLNVETLIKKEKAPQIEENTFEIESEGLFDIEEYEYIEDESSELNNDTLSELKEILDDDYPMKSDIEIKLIMLLNDSSSYERSEIANKIIKQKIKSDTIENFLVINGYILAA